MPIKNLHVEWSVLVAFLQDDVSFWSYINVFPHDVTKFTQLDRNVSFLYLRILKLREESMMIGCFGVG